MNQARKLLLLFFLLPCTFLVGQETPLSDSTLVNLDTTIYQVVAEMPRFPGCEKLDTTIQVMNECAQGNLLNFIYSNVRYPIEARQNGYEGTVVVRFVVEQNGTVSSPEIVRDIGGGCGAEVLRLIYGMNTVGLKWRPGHQEEKPVRVYFNLPVKFRLEEAPPYLMVDRDTVYTELDTPLEFKGAEASVEAFLEKNLPYPAMGNDSCAIGYMEAQVLVEPDATVKILDLNDFNNLGLDFQMKMIGALTSTIGQWNVATYKGRKVPSAYQLRHAFIPTDTTKKCQEKITVFEQANLLAMDGVELFNKGEKEAGIAKLTEAINLFPENADFRYNRGEAYLNMNKLADACEDLTKVQDILLVNWYKDILPIICRSGDK